MPYETIEELPDNVRDNLPAHAQKIYKEAFNSAREQYDHEEGRAHRVAWAAVILTTNRNFNRRHEDQGC